MRTLLCTALLPPSCACGAAVRSSIVISTNAADLNYNKKKALIFFFVIAQDISL